MRGCPSLIIKNGDTSHKTNNNSINHKIQKVMKKKLLTLAVALLAATGAWAQTTFTADNLIYTVTSSTTHTVEVTNFESGLARELNIPATVTHEGTTYNVTSIRNWVFYNCNTITAVTIPGSVTSIGESAFKECKALTAVTISEGVTTIKRGAFTECSALTAITIPESVTSIGESTFKNCFALTTINIPTNLTKIEKYMFEGCKALTTITIPENVTSIGERVFYKCTSLTQINVDEANTAYCSENGVLFNKDKTRRQTGSQLYRSRQPDKNQYDGLQRLHRTHGNNPTRRPDRH